MLAWLLTSPVESGSAYTMRSYFFSLFRKNARPSSMVTVTFGGRVRRVGMEAASVLHGERIDFDRVDVVRAVEEGHAHVVAAARSDDEDLGEMARLDEPTLAARAVDGGVEARLRRGTGEVLPPDTVTGDPAFPGLVA